MISCDDFTSVIVFVQLKIVEGHNSDDLIRCIFSFGHYSSPSTTTQTEMMMMMMTMLMMVDMVRMMMMLNNMMVLMMMMTAHLRLQP